MHRDSPAPFATLRLDDGDVLMIGKLRLQAMRTPGHTRDSICLMMDDRIFTGDRLLIGGTGRTDLPGGNAGQLYDSLFGKVLQLPPEMPVHPAPEYKERSHTRIGAEIADNPRLQVKERDPFIAMMGQLNLNAPTHLTEALRTNMNGGKTVDQLLNKAAVATPFITISELARRIANRRNDLLILDVREKDAFIDGHIPGAFNLPRGQLELRVNKYIPDPTLKIVTYCEFGKVSMLAAATLRNMGFIRASALDGGMTNWRAANYAIETGQDD